MIYCTENHFSPFSSLLIKMLKYKRQTGNVSQKSVRYSVTALKTNRKVIINIELLLSGLGI